MAYKKGQTRKKINKNVYYIACYVDKKTIEKIESLSETHSLSKSEIVRRLIKNNNLID